MTLEEAMEKIQALERENAMLKGERHKNRYQLAAHYRGKYDIGDAYMEQIGIIIRGTCFQKRPGCGVHRRGRAVFVREMTDEMYSTYLEIGGKIFEILDQYRKAGKGETQ